MAGRGRMDADGWTRLFANHPDWRGVEVNEEPDTGRTEYYTLHKKTFQPGDTVLLGPAFNPDACDPASPAYDEAVANGHIMPCLVFARPSLDMDEATPGTPPALVITSPNSTRMNRPNKIHGTLDTRAACEIRVSVAEERTGNFLNAGKKFACGTSPLLATTSEADGKTAWELEVSGVDFKRGRNNTRDTVNRGDRYFIDAVAVANGHHVRASAHFQLFYMEPPPENWDEAWEDYLPNKILKHINPPDISNPKNVVRIDVERAHAEARRRGEGDEKKDCAQILNDAIRECSRLGGGRVVVPRNPGNEETVYFVDGPVLLDDNVELHLEEGARLLFGFSPEKYPTVRTRWGDFSICNYSPLVFASGKKNVAITGKGVLDGNGGADNWHQWYKPLGSKDESVCNMMALCDARVPLELRRFGHGAGPGYEMLRPPLVQFYNCGRVLIEGVKFRNSPLYNLDLEFCENVTVRGIEIRPVDYENIYHDDGVDVVSSNHVLVEDCDIFVSDDAIVVKSGLNMDAWGRKPSTNLVFRNNILRTAGGAGSVALGSGVSGGIFNVFASGNLCGFGTPVYLKASMIRGGEVSNAYFKDMSAAKAFYGVWIQSDYDTYGPASGAYPARFAKVYIDRLTVGHTLALSLNIKGTPGMKISGLYFNDVVIRSTEHMDEVADTEDFYASGMWIPAATGSNPPLRPFHGDSGEIPPRIRPARGEAPQ